MLYSMTGFGQSRKQLGDKTIIIELRSLNSKYTDLKMKLPMNYRNKESNFRKVVMDRVDRGKLDLLIDIQSNSGLADVNLNKSMFRGYWKALHDLAEELEMDKAGMLEAILRIPNIIGSDDGDIDPQEWAAIINTLEETITSFDHFRQTEGAAMGEELKSRIIGIEALLDAVKPFEEGRMVTMRQRIQQNLEDFVGKENVDNNRFEQEMIFYLEKIDITEEKVRLSQHCKFFVEELEKKDSIKGRKLGFISQEIGREINTLGSKAYSAEVQRLVVNMKDELEKIKELVANLV